jgi:hypothetical protein
LDIDRLSKILLKKNLDLEISLKMATINNSNYNFKFILSDYKMDKFKIKFRLSLPSQKSKVLMPIGDNSI